MSLLDAPVYDPAAERRRTLRTAVIIGVAIVLGMIVYLNRFWPEVHVVNNFFVALEKKDYNTAYGIWMADPKWEQHPQKYARYPFNEFYTDWGPGGEWGIINNHKIEGALQPKGGNGVVVSVIVNGRAEPAHIWVDKSDKTLSFSPY
jgi:hypothetical protein